MINLLARGDVQGALGIAALFVGFLWCIGICLSDGLRDGRLQLARMLTRTALIAQLVATMMAVAFHGAIGLAAEPAIGMLMASTLLAIGARLILVWIDLT